MSRLMLFVFVAISLLSAAIVPAQVQAQVPAQKQANVSGYTYDGVLAQGHALYMTANYVGAQEQYEQAKSMEPGKPLAYYFVACALAKQARFDEAVTILQSIATIAGTSDVDMHAKSLFRIATIWEEASNLERAKTAWTEYLQFAKGHADAKVFVSIAELRLEAIEKWEKLNSDYQIVRDRIAAGNS